jgi:probable DNA metabolism protein
MFIRTDNSYGNLLTAIDWCLRSEEKPDGFLTADDCPLLIDCRTFLTVENISIQIRNDLKSRISAAAAARIMLNAWLAWLSEESAIALRLYEYLHEAYRSGRDPSDAINHPAAVAVSEAAKKCTRMAHSYKGILRFRQSGGSENNFYLAEIDPDCNVLPLIAGHFADRFADQKFLIIDRLRKIVFVHNSDGSNSLHNMETGNSSHSEIMGMVCGIFDDEVTEYWKKYLSHLSIPERVNHRLQKSNLPLKYRKHMSEFQ